VQGCVAPQMKDTAPASFAIIAGSSSGLGMCHMKEH
jgi:hypothetical protein